VKETWSTSIATQMLVFSLQLDPAEPFIGVTEQQEENVSSKCPAYKLQHMKS